MIEMNFVVFILMVVLFLAFAFATFIVGAFAGTVYQREEDEKRINSTEIFKLEE